MNIWRACDSLRRQCRCDDVGQLAIFDFLKLRPPQIATSLNCHNHTLYVLQESGRVAFLCSVLRSPCCNYAPRVRKTRSAAIIHWTCEESRILISDHWDGSNTYCPHRNICIPTDLPSKTTLALWVSVSWRKIQVLWAYGDLMAWYYLWY